MDAKRILLIDDNALVLRAVAAMLRSMGWEVYVAETADDGMSKARTTHPVAVIVDRTVPTPSGEELAMLIRGEFPELPLIVVSGGAFDDQRPGDPRRRNLPKPFGPNELLKTLRQLDVG